MPDDDDLWNLDRKRPYIRFHVSPDGTVRDQKLVYTPPPVTEPYNPMHGGDDNPVFALDDDAAEDLIICENCEGQGCDYCAGRGWSGS